jgi:hypothetical protein
VNPSRRVSYNVLHLCNYSILILCIVGLLGFAVFGGFFPPPGAYLSAEQIGTFFRQNSVDIRVGMVLMFLSMPFYLSWTIGMSKLMQRMQNDSMNVLPQLQAISGAVAMITLLGPAICWMTAAFRPGVRSNEEIQLLYDLGWFVFDPPFMIFAIQWGAIGFAMLTDKRERPLFPSWIAWVGFFTCATFISTTMISFMTHGPFAWQGLITFWLVFCMFFVYLFAVVPLTRTALRRLEAEDREYEGAASA